MCIKNLHGKCQRATNFTPHTGVTVNSDKSDSQHQSNQQYGVMKLQQYALYIINKCVKRAHGTGTQYIDISIYYNNNVDEYTRTHTHTHTQRSSIHSSVLHLLFIRLLLDSKVGTGTHLARTLHDKVIGIVALHERQPCLLLIQLELYVEHL